MRNGPCPQCGSTNILSDLPVMVNTRHGEEYVYVKMQGQEPADAPFFWERPVASTNFSAVICAGCGHTEFYAYNYESLRDMVTRNNEIMSRPARKKPSSGARLKRKTKKRSAGL